MHDFIENINKENNTNLEDYISNREKAHVAC